MNERLLLQWYEVQAIQSHAERPWPKRSPAKLLTLFKSNLHIPGQSNQVVEFEAAQRALDNVSRATCFYFRIGFCITVATTEL